MSLGDGEAPLPPLPLPLGEQQQQHEALRLDALARYGILDTLPEQVYDDMTLLAAHICQTPMALISLVDAERQWFKSRLGLDVSHTPRRISFCEHAIAQPETVFVVPDAQEDIRFSDNPLVTDSPNIRFYAGAPILTPDQFALGTICVLDRVPRRLKEDQLKALEALSRQIVSLFELRLLQARLEDANTRLAEMATLDSLTGLKNHGAFQERLETEIQRAQRYRKSLSLILLDVDGFKSFNDDFGHPAGDETLAQVGRLLRQSARASDVVARYGGEEFAVILPETAKTQAMEAAERFQKAIEIESWPHRAVTASVGVATRKLDKAAQSCLPSPADMDREGLIAAADKALYSAKRAGRNCIRHSEEL